MTTKKARAPLTRPIQVPVVLRRDYSVKPITSGIHETTSNKFCIRLYLIISIKTKSSRNASRKVLGVES